MTANVALSPQPQGVQTSVPPTPLAILDASQFSQDVSERIKQVIIYSSKEIKVLTENEVEIDAVITGLEASLFESSENIESCLENIALHVTQVIKKKVYLIGGHARGYGGGSTPSKLSKPLENTRKLNSNDFNYVKELADANGLNQGLYLLLIRPPIKGLPDSKKLEAMVDVLKDNGANVNAPIGSRTMLYWFCLDDSRINSALLLIKKGANINLPNADGSAIYYHYVNDLLLGKKHPLFPEIVKAANNSAYKLDVNAGTHRVLELVYKTGRVDIIKEYIQKGCKILDSDFFNYPILFHPELLSLAIEKGAKLNIKNAQKEPLLIFVVKNIPKSEDLIPKFREQGVNFNEKDAQGHSALYYAVENACRLYSPHDKPGENFLHKRVVALLDNGADLSGPLKSEAPAIFDLATQSAQAGNKYLLEQLTQWRVIPSAPAVPSSEQPATTYYFPQSSPVVPPVESLERACREGNDAQVELLLRAGTLPNEDCLIIAIERGNTIWVSNFLPKVCPLTNRAFLFACKSRNGHVLSAFIKAGCQVDSTILEEIFQHEKKSNFETFVLDHLIQAQQTSRETILEVLHLVRYLQLPSRIQNTILLKFRDDPKVKEICKSIAKQVVIGISNEIYANLELMGNVQKFEDLLGQTLQNSQSMYLFLFNQDAAGITRQKELVEGLIQKANAVLGKKMFFDPEQKIFRIEQITEQINETVNFWKSGVALKEKGIEAQREAQDSLLNLQRLQLEQQKNLEQQRERLAKEEAEQRFALAQQELQHREMLARKLNAAEEKRLEEARQLLAEQNRKQELRDWSRRQDVYAIQSKLNDINSTLGGV